MTEWAHQDVLLLAGVIEGAYDMDLVDLALQAAARSGKQVVVDLSGVEFMGASMLCALLGPGREAASRPWLCGPFQVAVDRLFEVTGVLGVFRVFPDLLAATRAARPGV
ncbi:STAS domain-containing protein [Streptomyces seoulensis]